MGGDDKSCAIQDFHGPVTCGIDRCLIGRLHIGDRRCAALADLLREWHVAMVSVWFLPILFLIEWMTRGKLLENTVEGVSGMGRFVTGRLVAGAFFVEMCLWGPRMVTGGVRQQIGLSRHRHADRTLAAAMVAELVNRGDGLPIGELYALANNRDEMMIQAELNPAEAGRKYAHEALLQPAFLRKHWRAMLGACRKQLKVQS